MFSRVAIPIYIPNNCAGGLPSLYTLPSSYCLRIFFSPHQTYLLLIEGKLLHNIELASAIHQHESAMGVHVSPPSLTSPLFPLFQVAPEPHLSLSHRAKLHCLSTLHMVVCAPMPLSVHLTLPFCPSMSPRLFSASPLVPSKRFISTIFLDSIYVC